jgi:hypothetical protein
MRWILISCLLAGCAHTQPWYIGAPINDLIERNGGADRIVTLSDGSQVYTWETLSSDRNRFSTCRVSYRVANGVITNRSEIC